MRFLRLASPSIRIRATSSSEMMIISSGSEVHLRGGRPFPPPFFAQRRVVPTVPSRSRSTPDASSALFERSIAITMSDAYRSEAAARPLTSTTGVDSVTRWPGLGESS